MTINKITVQELEKLVANSDVAKDKLDRFFIVSSVDINGDYEIFLNPDTVVLPSDTSTDEDAMSIGNGLAKMYRRVRYTGRKVFRKNLPVIVVEGDSWCEFPFLISDIVDHLSPHYNVLCGSGAGDELQNMAYGKDGWEAEFIRKLKETREDVRALLISGAGNDFLGIDPVTNDRYFVGLLNNFNHNKRDIQGHLNGTKIAQALERVERGYAHMIKTTHSMRGLEKLPILIHGYDYLFPYPASDLDPRNPNWVKPKDAWLGSSFALRGIEDRALRRELIIQLFDKLNERLDSIARRHQNVHYVNCRNTLPNLAEWADEIHPTSSGFKKIAQKFVKKLGAVI